jgi:hypothetical protein
LFVKYQISPDLLAFDGPADAPGDSKLAAVKSSVAAIQAVIEEAKQRQLDERQQEHDFAHPKTTREEKGVSTDDAGGRKSAPSMEQSYPVGFEYWDLEEDNVCDSEEVIEEAPASQESHPPPIDEDRSTGVGHDITLVPAEMDARFEELDPVMRPTTISVGEYWSKSSWESLLATASTKSILFKSDQRSEKQRAMDLLDALTRSGALPLEHTVLHVVICATHAFDKTLVDTVIQSNQNPIEAAERSALIMATTVHGLGPRETAALVHPSQHSRLRDETKIQPSLFD